MLFCAHEKKRYTTYGVYSILMRLWMEYYQSDIKEDDRKTTIPS